MKRSSEISVILHNVRSLNNVGSIFRTADAAGVEKIYLCGITPEPTDRFGKLRSQLTKVSLGAEKTVPWEKATRTTSLIKKLKKQGYKIYAVEQGKKSVPYYKFSGHSGGIRDFRVALILGNEVKGLSPTILKQADKILEIPMSGKKESLNVAVAFGIIIYRLIYV